MLSSSNISLMWLADMFARALLMQYSTFGYYLTLVQNIEEVCKLYNPFALTLYDKGGLQCARTCR